MQKLFNRQFATKSTVVILLLISFFPLYIAYLYNKDSQQTFFLNDDSFITLTYAKNLSMGNGFIYNHAPATLGTTTPLFAVVVAVLGTFLPSIELDVIAVFFTVLCWIGVVWTFFFFRKTWGLQDWQAGIVGLVVIASGWVEFLGMEAYLFSFLLVVGLSVFFEGHYLLSGFIAGMLFLTRGEGILIIFLLVAVGVLREWSKRKVLDIRLFKSILHLGLGFIVPVLIWIIYAQMTFGAFLPNTLAAKQAQVQSGLWRPMLMRLLAEWLPLWGKQFAINQMPLINFWWLFVLLGMGVAILRQHRWLIFGGWIALYILGYTLLGVSAYWWYQLPILFVLQLFFGLGVSKGVGILINRVKPSIISVSPSFLLVVALLINLAQPTVNAAMHYPNDSRSKSYIAISKWLRENTTSDESVASIEIGCLGYYTDNRIIDLAGLILPVIVPHVAEGDFAWGFWYYMPDYYVYWPDFDWALGGIRANAEFDRLYQPITTIDGPGPHDADFVIYKRITQ